MGRWVGAAPLLLGVVWRGAWSMVWRGGDRRSSRRVCRAVQRGIGGTMRPGSAHARRRCSRRDSSSRYACSCLPQQCLLHMHCPTHRAPPPQSSCAVPPSCRRPAVPPPPHLLATTPPPLLQAKRPKKNTYKYDKTLRLEMKNKLRVRCCWAGEWGGQCG